MLLDTGRFFIVGGNSNSAPEEVVCLDLNGDGYPDLITANRGDFTVSVLLNTGNGVFEEPDNYSFGDDAVHVAVGDLNGDDLSDLAVTVFPSSVNVMIGNGDGTFGSAVAYSTGIYPFEVAIGDLDGDTVPDLATVNSGSDSITVLSGNGDGTFQSAVSHPVGGDSPRALAIADLDGDLTLDLVSVDYQSDTVSVLLGLGGGAFQSAVPYATGDGPCDMTVADLDGDSVPDLISANYRSNDASVLLGNGDGTFQAAAAHAGYNRTRSAVARDLDGDHVPDLILANLHTVSVLIGIGDGTFLDPEHYTAGIGAYCVSIEDLNADGADDLAVACAGGGYVSVIFGNGDGTFAGPGSYDIERSPYEAVMADVNGDTVPDLVAANSNYFDHSVSVLIGRGDATFEPAVNYDAGDGPRSVACGDLNGDGTPDIVVPGNEGGQVFILVNNGDGTFQPAFAQAAGDGPGSVAIGDLDGDQIPDLAVADMILGTALVLVFIGNGDGTFQTFVDYPAGDHPDDIVLADLNEDGDLDIAVSNEYVGQAVTILLNNGDGTFQTPLSFYAGHSPAFLAVGYLDSDDHLDLAVVNRDPDTLEILPGNGDGTFQTAVEYSAPIGAGTGSVSVEDIDGDGVNDVAWVHYFLDAVSIRPGNGDGSLQEPAYFSCGRGPISVTLGDLDDDGDLDLATVGSTEGSVYIINNNLFTPKTVSAALTCVPDSGTVPFTCTMSVSLKNRYQGLTRRVAAQIGVQLAGGRIIGNWRSGFTNIAAGESYDTFWSQGFPALGFVIGPNRFTLTAEDVTPAPYNQPPHPPSGDTDTAVCTVTGQAP